MRQLPDDELYARFDEIQGYLDGQVPELTGYSERPHTVVVIPSLTLDMEQLDKIKGISYYEERMLYLLLLLRQPRARVILVTSQLVDRSTIDYVLRQLPNQELASARERLTVLSTNDWTPRSLSEKVLERPWLLERIKGHIPDPHRAHLATFNMTVTEMRLAVELGIPVVGLDPRLEHLGTKSGNREVFREAGVSFPVGREGLRGPEEIPAAISEVWCEAPDTKRVLVKLNEGFSGEGNAILDLRPLAHFGPREADEAYRRAGLEGALERLVFQAQGETWENFARQFAVRGGIVEAFVEGETKTSPSAQLNVDVTGTLHFLSTHDQILGGKMNQIFQGCRFPADEAYRVHIQEEAKKIGRVLCERGVRGRFAVDFVAVKQDDGSWDTHAIEINIRRGGTTHPFGTMHYLVQGNYDESTGQYFAPDGTERCYFASDNIEETWLSGLLPADLHTIIEAEELGFDHSTKTGGVFHMIGAASQFSKIGFTVISTSLDGAMELADTTKARIKAAVQKPRYDPEVGQDNFGVVGTGADLPPGTEFPQPPSDD